MSQLIIDLSQIIRNRSDMKMKPGMAQKNFKKKNSNLTIEIPKEKPRLSTSDRFEQLRSKLEKEKQMVKKTGRRFKDQNSINIQTQAPDNKQLEVKSKQHQKCEIMIGTDDPLPQSATKTQKDIVNLNQIQIQNDQSSVSSLTTSRVFEKQMKNQKKRSAELHQFLKNIELEGFFDGLVSAGFDDLDALSGITSEDLNHLMMRGRQQDKLFLSLKKNNLLEEDDKLETKSSRPSTSSTQFRLKTDGSSLQNSNVKQSHRVKTLSTYELLLQAKKPGTEEKPRNFMGSSFIYMVGSKNWSIEDQVRKACSNCFRVTTQMQKKGDCFYCESCYKIVSDDLLNINIGSSMNRSYYKSDE